MISIEQRPFVGRFAPSPTGRMHAGNIFAYLMAWLSAKSRGGKVLLRIEDLDEQRSRAEYADMIMRDLESLGLFWDGDVLFQSTRKQDYAEALEILKKKGTLYECFCTRDQANVQSAPHSGEMTGYRGTCRALSDEDRAISRDRALAQGRAPSLRCKVDDEIVCFHDIFQGDVESTLVAPFDDFVVRRSDELFAYQLAVVVDDAFQGINSIVRGYDLVESTKKQVHLQEELSFPKPEYGHVPLLVNTEGRRLSKRDADASLEALSMEYGSTEGVIGHIAHIAGITDADEPATPEQLLKVYDEAKLKRLYRRQHDIVYS